MIVGVLAKEQTTASPVIGEDYVWVNGYDRFLFVLLKEEAIRIYNSLLGPTKYKITLKKV